MDQVLVAIQAHVGVKALADQAHVGVKALADQAQLEY
jgi:hypothetical protein